MFFVDDVVENSNTVKKPEKSQFYVFGSCAPFQDHAVFCVGGCKSALSLCRKSSEIIGSCRERAFLLQKAFLCRKFTDLDRGSQVNLSRLTAAKYRKLFLALSPTNQYDSPNYYLSANSSS